MSARRTLLALSLLAGAGVLASAPAQAGHDRAAVVYQVGGYHRDYYPPARHRAGGYHHYPSHWRADRRHHGGHRWAYRGYREHGRYRHYERGEPHYRIRIEYGD